MRRNRSACMSTFRWCKVDENKIRRYRKNIVGNFIDERLIIPNETLFLQIDCLNEFIMTERNCDKWKK